MIEIDKRELNDIINRLGGSEKKAKDVLRRTLNRVGAKVRTELDREVRRTYMVKQKDVLKVLKFKKGTHSDICAEISAKGGFMPLQYFKTSPTLAKAVQNLGIEAKPIKARVKKSGSLKKVAGMFAQVSTKTGNVNLMKRLSGSRYPAPMVMGPSLPEMFGNKEILSEIEEVAAETYHKRLEHEIGYVLSKGGG